MSDPSDQSSSSDASDDVEPDSSQSELVGVPSVTVEADGAAAEERRKKQSEEQGSYPLELPPLPPNCMYSPILYPLV